MQACRAESGETVIRISMLRNYPVILSSSRVGIVQNVSVDLTRKKVDALMISCGLRGRRMILSDHILAVAEGFILAESMEKRTLEVQRRFFVRDTAGLLLGCISDYAIDENTLEICAVEMISGYLPSAIRRRIWIYDYAQTEDKTAEITVSAALSCELNRFKGGKG